MKAYMRQFDSRLLLAVSEHGGAPNPLEYNLSNGPTEIAIYYTVTIRFLTIITKPYHIFYLPTYLSVYL